MTIVCGTDFSPAAEAACAVAVRLAANQAEPLLLVHALVPMPLPPPPDMPVLPIVYDDATERGRAALAELAARLGASGAAVETLVELGDPDDVLLRLAADRGARLIVLGAVGRRGARWLLGSTADRLAARSPVPVLVTREGFPAASWLDERQPLRVLVGSDLGPATAPAVEWATHLTEHGPCRFTIAHVSWPPDEYERLAIDRPMRLDRTHPVVEEVLRRDLDSAAEVLRAAGETEVVVESNVGRIGDALSGIARRVQADLIVVGRGRAEERQWWEGSTSRAVVRRAAVSVLCVPDRDEEADIAPPEVRRILAATDLSRRGNAAVAWALALARGGADVRVVHVMEKDDPAEAERRRERLDQLVRIGSAAGASVEILTGDEPARIISAEAERFGADVICVGSRGRSGLTRMLFGSVSQELLLRSERPVLLVQSPAAARAKPSAAR